MAQTGALRCAYTENTPSVDINLQGRVYGASQCQNARSYADGCARTAAGNMGDFFCWSCELDEPGTAATTEAWSKTYDWVSPAGCGS